MPELKDTSESLSIDNVANTVLALADHFDADGAVSTALYAISRGLKTTEPHEGEPRTAADSLHALATGAHRIADALEQIADAMRGDDE